MKILRAILADPIAMFGYWLTCKIEKLWVWAYNFPEEGEPSKHQVDQSELAKYIWEIRQMKNQFKQYLSK